MTLDEIKQQYPDQWVLIELGSLDDELRVIDGTVVAHSPSREEIDKRLMATSKERIAVEFTGERDTDESYFL
ncbi:MAG: hypothetical protein WD894_05525 [Pirellulales bacterium]